MEHRVGSSLSTHLFHVDSQTLDPGGFPLQLPGLARMHVLKQLMNSLLQCNLLPSDIGIITINSIHQGMQLGFWSSLWKSTLPLGK